MGGLYAEENLFSSTMIGALGRVGGKRPMIGCCDWRVLLQEEVGIKVPKPQSLGVAISGWQ